jgi:hypothetical protein
MRRLIFISTLPHLDQPVIDNIKRLAKADLEIEVYDFYGTFNWVQSDTSAAVGFTNLELLIELRNSILHGKLKSFKGLATAWIQIRSYKIILRRYQTELVNFLEERNPDVVVLTSDHNFSLDLLNQTSLLERVVIIQPALITWRRTTIKFRVKDLFFRAVNRLYQLPIYTVGYNWGDKKYNCKYLLWSQLEDPTNFSNMGLCGDVFMENFSNLNFSNSSEISSILIILPNLSLEQSAEREFYVSTLVRLGESLPNVNFILRWHPSDSFSNEFEQVRNFSNFEDDARSESYNFDYVVSSVSALAINLRRRTPNLLIFHPGQFGRLGGGYITSEFFQICTDLEDILIALGSNHVSNKKDFRALFRLDEPSKAFLSRFFISIN